MRRRLTAGPGQIRVAWAKLPYQNPDIVFAWGGAGADSSDARLIMYHLSEKRYDPIDQKWERSLLDELKARGYDLTTLRFEVSKPVSQA